MGLACASLFLEFAGTAGCVSWFTLMICPFIVIVLTVICLILYSKGFNYSIIEADALVSKNNNNENIDV